MKILLCPPKMGNGLEHPLTLKWLLISKYSILVLIETSNNFGGNNVRNKKNIPLEVAGMSMKLRSSHV